MAREEFIALFTEKAGFRTKAEAAKAVDDILGLIQDGLVRDGTVFIRNFGKFSVRDRRARKGRDPRTGAPIEIPAGKTIKFSSGRELKNTLGKGAKGLDLKDFIGNMDFQLKDIKDKFDKYGKKAERLGVEAKKQYKEHAERIGVNYKEASVKLKQLSTSGGQAFKEMKKGFENAFKELKVSFKKALEKF
ncbi:MAG: HU family DNA-binding protein [Thermodesulfobacteriota bacterium]|nr:HU family DNA-binding protein [Thermodesulfobacteriota bacterium]